MGNGRCQRLFLKRVISSSTPHPSRPAADPPSPTGGEGQALTRQRLVDLAPAPGALGVESLDRRVDLGDSGQLPLYGDAMRPTSMYIVRPRTTGLSDGRQFA